MNTPTTITYHPRAGHKIMNGYGHTAHARPVTVPARRAWRKQATAWLRVTPGAHSAVVEFTNGEIKTIYAR